jgi:hypothetical protein
MKRSTVSAENVPGELVAQPFEPPLEVPPGDQIDVELAQLGGHRSAPSILADLWSPEC